MNTQPYWLDTATTPRFPKLDKSLRVDVAVVGGGITGVTAAYLLKRAGHSVALLERGTCGGAETGHTTAHLTYATDRRIHDLVDDFGRDDAQAVWDAGSAAMHEIARIVEHERLACGFARVPGYLHAPVAKAASEEELGTLRRDAEFADEMQFDAAYTASVPLVRRPGVMFANQALFHPVEYLSGLLKLIPGQGGFVFEQSEASEFSEKPLFVVANGHRVECRFIVIATHVPLMGNRSLLPATIFQSKLIPMSTYAIGARIPRGACAPALFWDTADPYCYLRIDRHANHDYAILGGEDHKTGQKSDTDACYRRLEQVLSSILPQAEIDHRWSGQVIETPDGLPFIGEVTEGQFVATGFAGNGMTFGTLAAMMAVDAFKGRHNPWADLFSAKSVRLKHGALDYLKQNLDYPYYMVKDRLTASEGEGLDSLKKGEGKILRVNHHKVAAYRDERGKVTTVSKVCPHMGCIVHWNKAEKTWDCPCHGSRFQATGEVIAGPAEAPLKPVDVEQETEHHAHGTSTR